MELTSREGTELMSSRRLGACGVSRGMCVSPWSLLGQCTRWAGDWTPSGLEWPSGPMALNVSPSDPTAVPPLQSLPPDCLQSGAHPRGPRFLPEPEDCPLCVAAGDVPAEGGWKPR